ncbi:hypothetical protein E8E14_006048 [Neopestalotiopsis sp. 37M]|nr:hypothetical protein E8E14_006048 [Neopestalotiopsis sp. 37M]
MPPRSIPTVSQPATRTIDAAFKDLNSTITAADSRDFPITTLQDVKAAAVEIEAQLAARQSLRNMRRLMPLFRGLEHYAKVMDVLCNGTPYLAWIWAPITLILRVASEYVEAFEVIMRGYSSIAESLVRFEILNAAFVDNHEFQQTLAVFYSDILQFHKFAYTFVKKSKANARHIAESQRRWQEAKRWREEDQERLAEQEIKQTEKQYRAIASWLKADDSEQVRIRDIASWDANRYRVPNYLTAYVYETYVKVYKMATAATLEQLLKTLFTAASHSPGQPQFIWVFLDGFESYYIERKIFYSRDEVKKAIDDLPQELTDYYRKILAQIIAPLDGQSVERVRSLFGWLAFTMRPLKRLELLSAITFSSSNHSIPRLVPDFILKVCGPLVEERANATVSFIHSTVKEFLESDSSNLPLNCLEAQMEHGIASVTCLLAGMDLFRGGVSEHEKNLKVVTGLHGFHLYAADYWIDYLMDVISTSSSTTCEVPLYQLAVALAVRGGESENEIILADDEKIPQEMEEKIAKLPDIPLRKLARMALLSRTSKALEHMFFVSNGMTSRLGVITRTGLVGDEKKSELQRFKNQFLDAAFTCRLGACPFATAGFDTEKARDEHEMAHNRRVACPFPDCRYPPFGSTQAMKKHTERYHSAKAPRKPVYRPRKAPSGTAGIETATQSIVPATADAHGFPENHATNISSVAERQTIGDDPAKQQIPIVGDHPVVPNATNQTPITQQSMRPRMRQQDWLNTLMSRIMTQQQETPPPSGWQAALPPQHRITNAGNLVTNTVLANPQTDQNQTMDMIINLEREWFLHSPTKEVYDQKIQMKLQELFLKRQVRTEPASTPNESTRRDTATNANVPVSTAGLSVFGTTDAGISQHMNAVGSLANPFARVPAAVKGLTSNPSPIKKNLSLSDYKNRRQEEKSGKLTT